MCGLENNSQGMESYCYHRVHFLLQPSGKTLLILRVILLDIFYSCHNSHQCNGLNNMHLLSYSYGAQKIEMGLTGLKSHGCIPPGCSKKESPAFSRL